MKKILFVFNPHSGKGRIRPNLVDIIDTFVKADCVPTVIPTQRPLHAYEIVRDFGSEFDLIVCSGGDGTLNEVVRGVKTLTHRVPIGYIPAGTTNDFAASLGMSRDNMLKGAYDAVNGVPFDCDFGDFNDITFNYIAAFGIFTSVSYETPQAAKNMMGQLAYILNGIQSLKNLEYYHITFDCDGTIIEDDFIFGMISNSMSIGGVKALGENSICLDDGLFEVALVKVPRNMMELQEAVNDVITLKIASSNRIYFLRAGNIAFKCDTPLRWTMDGEYGGAHKAGAIRNINKGMTYIIPAPEKSLEG